MKRIIKSIIVCICLGYLTSSLAETPVGTPHSSVLSSQMPSKISFGKIRVTTIPADATIFIDTTAAGKSPLTLDSITVGEHLITAKKKGHYVKKATIVVIADSMQEVSLTLLKPAQLNVISTPAATISIDALPAQQSPADFKDLKPGEHDLTAKAPGFLPYAQKVTLADGASDTIAITLTREGKNSPKGKTTTAPEQNPLVRRIAVGLFALFTTVILVIELSESHD